MGLIVTIYFQVIWLPVMQGLDARAMYIPSLHQNSASPIYWERILFIWIIVLFHLF